MMNNFRSKLIRFMYGRYGVDELYYGLFALWAVITLVNMFVGSVVLYLVGLAAIVIMITRSLSRNHNKRRRENKVFLKFWKPLKKWVILQRDRLRDVKTARYRKCPHCRAVIKLPNRRGKHTVVCPRCRARFGVKIL